MKRSILGGVALVAAVALVGCTDSGAPAPAPTPSESDAPAPAETYDIKVAALPIAETGAIWAALDAGIFEEHGINLEILPAQGGAQAIPALVSGDIDFAIGQPFGPFRAALAGEQVRLLTNYANSLPENPDVNSVVASAASGVTRWADLSGKKVSVNSPNAAGDLTIRAAVAADGGDPSTIEFVVVAFPDAPGQLEAGTIDAAWVPDPFRGMIVEAGGTDLGGPYQATIPGLTVLTNFTLQSVIDEDPGKVEAWNAALTDALAYASEHEDEVRAAISKYLEIPEAGVAGIVLPEFTADLGTAHLQELIDLALEFGYLDQAPDLSQLIAQ
ncbi:MAG: ABC transporter substrate-binding protein [Microbacteriaceae bacterium]|nr:ABC transporter substrate-binding protein [Microbacteriaceae bacterium]